MNFDPVLLDCAEITIGARTQIGLAVKPYTAARLPLDAPGMGTRDLPTGVIAVGKPYCVLRPLNGSRVLST